VTGGISFYRSRKQPDGCAPRGRTSCDGRSALPRHLRAKGLFCSRQQPDGCAPRGRTSCDGQSALPRHCVPRNGVQHKRFLAISGTRPNGSRAGQARPRGAQPKAAGVSEINRARRCMHFVVIPAKAGIHPSAGTLSAMEMDPRDKPEDDKSGIGLFRTLSSLGLSQGSTSPGWCVNLWN